MTKNEFRKPYLGRECDDCKIPIDAGTRHCTICKRYYPINKYDFDKDRCEYCGSYEVTMNDRFEWYCDKCQIWILSTNEGNGTDYADCNDCGDGFKPDDPAQTVCFWCT